MPLTKEQIAKLVDEAVRMPIVPVMGDRIEYVQVHRKQLIERLAGVVTLDQAPDQAGQDE